MDKKAFCGQPKTNYPQFTCYAQAAFFVGAEGKPAASVCAQHLVKATRAQAKLHDVEIVYVKPLPIQSTAAPAT